jgi:tetratricopeptide (TPR) repeat protein
LFNTHRPQQAALRFAEVVAGWPKLFGDDDHGSIGSSKNLYSVLNQTESHDGLLGPIEILFETYRRTLEPTDPKRLTCGLWLGRELIANEQWELAEEILTEVSDVQLEHAPFDDPDLNWTLANLARAYVGQERYEEAEPLLLDAHEAVKHTHKAEIASHLAKLYRLMERPEEAERWD